MTPQYSKIVCSIRPASGRFSTLSPEAAVSEGPAAAPPECQAVVKRPQCAARADPLRLVLRTQSSEHCRQQFSFFCSKWKVAKIDPLFLRTSMYLLSS